MLLTVRALLLALLPAAPRAEEAEPSRRGLQVIGAGLSRTGTQSLALALTELGYRTLHAEGTHPRIPLGRGTDMTPTITAAAMGYFKGGGVEALEPALQWVDGLGIDAVVDLPWSECVVDLLQRHPHAKVVVTVRDSAADWYRSYWEHFRWASVLPLVRRSSYMEYWRQVSSRTGCGFVTQWPPSVPSEEERADCLRAYDRRIEGLRSAVPPESLLVFSVKEGWEPLCHFLGLPVPNSTFPRHDSYSFLQWPVGPRAFLVAVYGAYAAILYVGARLVGVALRQGLYREAAHGKLA